MEILRPIVNLLETEKLCFLSTSYQDKPHLSLMLFTYLAHEKRILLSSKSETTKIKNIQKNPEVALLLYRLGLKGEESISFTIYGRAEFALSEQKDDYQRAHYERHKSMGLFTNSEDILLFFLPLEQAFFSTINYI